MGGRLSTRAGTHYFSALVVAPEALWLLVACRGHRRAVAAAAALPAVIALALVPLVEAQRYNPGAPEDAALGRRIGQIPKAFLVGFNSPFELAATAKAAACALVAVALLLTRAAPTARRRALIAALVAACVVVVPALVALVGSQYVFLRFVVVGLLPPAVLVAAVSWTSARWVRRARGLQRGVAGPRRGRGGRRSLPALGLARRRRGAVRARATGLVLTPGLTCGSASCQSGPWLISFSPVRPLPQRGARVREIASVAVASENRFSFKAPVPPRPGQAPPAPRGFRLVGRRDTDTYTMLLYRSRAPRTVTLDQGQAVALLPASPAVRLVQPKARSVDRGGRPSG